MPFEFKLALVFVISGTAAVLAWLAMALALLAGDVAMARGLLAGATLLTAAHFGAYVLRAATESRR